MEKTPPFALPFQSAGEPEPGLGWEELDARAVRTAGQPPFRVARFTVEPEFSSPVDSHAVHEIWLVVAGTGLLDHAGTTARVSAGQALYLEPPLTHQVRNDGDQDLVIHSIWWE